MAKSPAQSWNSVKDLAPGTSVRVSAASRTLSGNLRDVTDDSLLVVSGKAQETFARPEVKRVSVKKKGHRGRNALIGLGAGAGTGAIVGAASHRDCTGWCFFYTTRGQDAGIGALLFGILGAAAGALIPTGGWHEIYRQ